MKFSKLHLPKAWRLAAVCAAILLLLFMNWAILDYPALTAAGAFRRGLRQLMLPDGTKMELLLEQNRTWGNWEQAEETAYRVGIGADGENSYLVYLEKDNGWHPTGKVSVTPAAGQVWYALLPWDGFGPNLSMYQRGWEDPQQKLASKKEDIVPFAAVKAPGASASLTLVLEEWDFSEVEESKRPEPSQAVRYPLILQESRDGWFIFRFDMKTLWYRADWKWSEYEEHKQVTSYREPEKSLIEWVSYFSYSKRNPEDPNNRPLAPAHLELTCYDENGGVLLRDVLDLNIEKEETP